MPDFDELLVDLELRCEAGSPVDGDKVSPDSPELAAELDHRFERLQQVERLLLEGLDDPLADTELEATTPPIAGYTIERILGVGGMGCVYLARNHELNRVEALKVLRPHAALRTPEQKRRLAKRFLREAQTLASLKHEHIVSVYQGRPRADTPYFAMEFLPRGSLAQESERRRLMDAGPRAIVSFMIKVAQAVQYAHEHRVLHRDLKPGNILLNDEGEPIVSDFGLAKLLDPNAEPDDATLDSDPETPPSSDGATLTAALSVPGQALGTPRYMAPEQCTGDIACASPQTDVWALGVILYELLTGARPFQGQERNVLSRSIQEDQPPSLYALNPQVDVPLEAIVRHCLAKSVADRYGSAQALADDLALWLRHEAPRAYLESKWRRLIRRVHRFRLQAAAGALLAAVGLSLLVIRYHRDPRRTQEALAHKLDEGRAITLVGQTGPPVTYSIRSGAHRTKVLEESDQPFQVSTLTTTLVELWPNPPQEFQVQGEFRHEKSPGMGSVGFFFDYREPNQLLPWPSFYALSLCDRGQGSVRFKFADGRRGTRVLCAFKYLQPREGRDPGEGDHKIAAGPPFEGATHEPYPGPWRRFILRVKPSGIEGFRLKDDGELEQSFAATKLVLDRESIALAKVLALQSKEIQILQPSFRPYERGPMGIYVSDSVASIRNVVLEPWKSEP